MKAATIIMILGLAIPTVGATAWSGGNGHASDGWADGNTHVQDGYGCCSRNDVPSAASQSPATQPGATVGDGTQPSRCGHWWGWMRPGHRANCCGSMHGRHDDGYGRRHGGCC